MDILLILSLIFFGFAIGNFYAHMKFWRLINKVASDEGVDLEKEMQKIEERKEGKLVYKLTVEKHNDILYLYDRESNDFVCQGKTLEELAELCKKYKNIKHGVVLHENKVFMFVDGLSKEYSQ